MPLPLIPIIIAAASVLIGGGALAAYLNWDDLKIKWKGKKLAVLGQRGVGKTQLITFLTSGTVPEEYFQTEQPTAYSGKVVSFKDLELVIKKGLDVSGSKDAYKEWKELVSSAGVVLYLFRTDLVYAGHADHEERIRNDARHLELWLKERASVANVECFVVGTHCDKIPEFQALKASNKGDFVDRIRKKPIIAELMLRTNSVPSKFVAGGLDSIEGLQLLALALFKTEKT